MLAGLVGELGALRQAAAHLYRRGPRTVRADLERLAQLAHELLTTGGMHIDVHDPPLSPDQARALAATSPAGEVVAPGAWVARLSLQVDGDAVLHGTARYFARSSLRDAHTRLIQAVLAEQHARYRSLEALSTLSRAVVHTSFAVATIGAATAGETTLDYLALAAIPVLWYAVSKAGPRLVGRAVIASAKRHLAG